MSNARPAAGQQGHILGGNAKAFPPNICPSMEGGFGGPSGRRAALKISAARLQAQPAQSRPIERSALIVSGF